MDTIRTFVAVELPAEFRKRLADTQAQLREAMGGAEKAVRWSRVDGVHLTLQFLGDVPFDSVAAILEAVRAGCVGTRPIELVLGNVGAFPTIQKPRVLWLGLDGDTARLQTLQANIAKHLSALGYLPDKPFAPHITLGRVREQISKDELMAISQALQQVGSRPVPPTAFTAQEVRLMRSDLRPTGAVYTALGIAELDR